MITIIVRTGLPSVISPGSVRTDCLIKARKWINFFSLNDQYSITTLWSVVVRKTLWFNLIDNGLYCLIWLKLNKMLNYFFLERDFTYETLTNKIMCYDRSVVPIILGLTAKVSPAIMVHIYNCHAVFNKVVTKSTPLSLLLPYMFPYQQLKINGSSNWSVHVNSKHWLIYR